MKKNCLFFALICLSTLVLLTACNGKFSGYKRTADGLYYKFYHQNVSAQKPNLTDFVKVEMACYLNDSLYFDWQGTGHDVYAQLTESKFPADLQEAYAMMRVGDSASFYIKADSIAIKYYEQDPEIVGLKAEDYFRYEVKLVDVMSQEDFEGNIEHLKEQMKAASEAALADYIEREGIKVTPTESGIYIIPVEKGIGRCPVKGEKVELDFEVFLLNGQSVGSTFGKDEKFSFVLGEGYTIQGWEEIVPKMHLGERVRAIIPSEMAYGEYQVGNIPAYSNVIYDIKLLKITTQEELLKQTEKELEALRVQSEQEFWDYLKENNITEHTVSGLFYSKSVTTEGAMPQKGQTACIKFVASYLDGTLLGTSDQLGEVYDVAYGEGKVLRGLEEGIGLMKVGEKARFVLPYNLAYGSQPYGNIPAYSNLIFDVELVEIK